MQLCCPWGLPDASSHAPEGTIKRMLVGLHAMPCGHPSTSKTEHVHMANSVKVMFHRIWTRIFCWFSDFRVGSQSFQLHGEEWRSWACLWLLGCCIRNNRWWGSGKCRASPFAPLPWTGEGPTKWFTAFLHALVQWQVSPHSPIYLFVSVDKRHSRSCK